MILKQANIWDEPDLSYICITTNATVKANGELVMGAGVALQAKKRVPGIAEKWGADLRATRMENRAYGMMLKHGKYLAFQTKLFWRDKAKLHIIKHSAQALEKLARSCPDITFGLPFPGIGYGQLNPKDVLPLLESLPDNVIVFHTQPLE